MPAKMNKHDELLKAAAEAALEYENKKADAADAAYEALDILERANDGQADPRSSIKIAILKLNKLVELVDD